jgi:hypothetical protein
MKLSKMTHSIKSFSIMTLNITTHSIKNMDIMAFSFKTVCKMT